MKKQKEKPTESEKELLCKLHVLIVLFFFFSFLSFCSVSHFNSSLSESFFVSLSAFSVTLKQIDT